MWAEDFFSVDGDGYLKVFDEWDTDWALYVLNNVPRVQYVNGTARYSTPADELLIAEWDGKKLTVGQLKLICFIRGFFSKNGRAPFLREMREGLSLSSLEIMDTAPWARMVDIMKAAGVHQPPGCL